MCVCVGGLGEQCLTSQGSQSLRGLYFHFEEFRARANTQILLGSIPSTVKNKSTLCLTASGQNLTLRTRAEEEYNLVCFHDSPRA